MCPDKELLSAYIDGEVPSPWKERIEVQIDDDPECSRILQELAGVRAAFRGSPEPDFSASQAAVLRRIDRIQPYHRPVPAWRRRVAVPVPVAAAAASLVLLLAGALLWHTARATVGPTDIPVVSHETELLIRIGEMSIEELLRVMNASDSLGEVTVKLPDTAMFTYLGEAQMMRAADFRSEDQILIPLTPEHGDAGVIVPDE